MDNIIRKVVIGPDIVNSGMNFSVGQIIRRKDGNLVISDILMNDDESIVIYVERDEAKFIWKRISGTTPTTIEYSIEF